MQSKTLPSRSGVIPVAQTSTASSVTKPEGFAFTIHLYYETRRDRSLP